MQKPIVENVSNDKDVVQGPDNKPATVDKVVTVNCRAKEEQQQPIVEELHQTLTRSRSFRRSRYLEIINPEALLNHTPLIVLLLEDIQNFHQKNITSLTRRRSIG
uniref:Uncharacterized protein n=1 Tax=Davidia involucrata TaxID=16924 RepID=A0A5B7C1I0_DAVIN